MNAICARYVVVGTLTLLLGLGASAPAPAQAVRVVATPIEPFEPPGARQQGRRQSDGIDGAQYLSLYATAFLGAPGEVEGLPKDTRTSMHYPTVHLLFSAAARPRPRGGEVAVARGLHRLNAHVVVEPLDNAMRPIADRAALEVLGTHPDSIARATHHTDTTNVKGAVVTLAARTLMPEAAGILGVAKSRMGPIVTKFSDVFHRPSAPTQVAYLSDHREFGWVWYEHPDISIEGTHRTTATFEAGPTVRFLRVEILLVADWVKHSAWQRRFEVVLDMEAATPKAAAQ